MYGLGSQARQSKPLEFTLIEEDTDGANPKYPVRDVAGVEWKLKIGLETRLEIAATRLVWAIGYHAHEAGIYAASTNWKAAEDRPVRMCMASLPHLKPRTSACSAISGSTAPLYSISSAAHASG